MKKIVTTISVLLLLFASCDKIENPIPIQEGVLDWSLLPGGDPATYTWPTWIQNTNTDRNVLIEDYTGHLCTNCPAAGALASQLENSNPGRVFVASVHASPSGSFQALQAPEFTTDFTTTAGDIYVNEMDGFLGNPMGTTNRTATGFQQGTVWQFDTDWTVNTNNILSNNQLDANLQLQYNHYPSTNAFFIHTETEFLSNLGGTYNLVIYLIRDTVIAPQKMNTGLTEEFYHHHSVLTDNINGAWGTQIVSDSISAGEKIYNDFSFQIPTGDTTYDINNLSLISYILNRKTYEILQVIKTKL